MAPKPPIAAKHASNPNWLIQAGIEGGWLGKDGKALPAGKKEADKKPASTSNTRSYSASQDLTELSAGFGGLKLSSSPSIPKKGEGIKLDGIHTIGHDKGTKLMVAHAPKFGTHTPKAPSLRMHPDTVLFARASSVYSRATGPKAPNAVGKPDALVNSGVVDGIRTFALVSPLGVVREG